MVVPYTIQRYILLCLSITLAFKSIILIVVFHRLKYVSKLVCVGKSKSLYACIKVSYSSKESIVLHYAVIANVDATMECY